MSVARMTWAELASHGAALRVIPGWVIESKVPKWLAPAAKAALSWRVETMRVQFTARKVPSWQAPVLVAKLGLSQDGGHCRSCGEEFTEGKGHAGDCVLCVAARVTVYKESPAKSLCTEPPRETPVRGELL